MNGTLQSAAQTFWRGMLGLILPRGCAGCDKPDEILCSDCQSLFRRHTVLPLNGTPSGASDGTPGAATAPNALNGIPSAAIQQPACAMIYAAGTYQGHVRRAILSWKDHGDTECDKAFSQICRQLVAGSGIIETLQTKPQTLSQPMPDGTPNRQSNTNTGRTRTIITQIHAHTRAQTPLAARESHSRRAGSRRSGSLCRERATNTARTRQSRGNPQRTRQGSPTRRAVGGERPGAYSGQESADPGRHCDHRDNHAPVRRSDTWGAGERGGRIGARRRPTAC